MADCKESSERIVFFDNWPSHAGFAPVSFLHTFLLTQKSMGLVLYLKN